jgi:hypothetical protein
MTSEYHLFVLLMLLRTLAMCFIPPKVCLAFAPSLVLANTPPHGLGHGDAGPFGHIDGDGLATVPDPPPLEALHKRAQRQTHHLHGKALTRAPSPSHPKRRHPLPVALPAFESLRRDGLRLRLRLLPDGAVGRRLVCGAMSGAIGWTRRISAMTHRR